MEIRLDGSMARHKRLGVGRVFLHENLATGVKYKFYPNRKSSLLYQVVDASKISSLK